MSQASAWYVAAAAAVVRMCMSVRGSFASNSRWGLVLSIGWLQPLPRRVFWFSLGGASMCTRVWCVLI